MAIPLKQSTAVTVTIGPFLDATDGVTAETALTISQADVRLRKNGGTVAQKNESSAATHSENGYYACALDATDTNTLGILEVSVSEAGAAPVTRVYQVLPANVYDSLFSTDKLEVDLVQIAGSTTDATRLGRMANARITGTAATGTLSINQMTTSLTGFSADQINRRILRMTSGSCAGEATFISDYNATGGLISFAVPLTTAPANGDAFLIE